MNKNPEFIFCNIFFYFRTSNTILREMDAVGEWSHSSDMDCEKDKQRIRRLVKLPENFKHKAKK